ncbi:response regulator transcription factor [Lysinibacter sp. HNR]|uniref:response regulator n=1 Tax=Lysinibacter sp. HNR TaxID=3031408 RepID=UPI0024356CEF|nr:response regulator transcription factor [Lysinibacter sp. HNR]WGD38166.1 response regulator transcription factor [Lysinibacter sp. HNR]
MTAAQTQDLHNPIAQKIRVAIVDDQQLFCAGMKLLVDSQEDLEVVGMAHNGSDAVVLAKESRPDVILMDVRMPILNGIDATAKILAEASQSGEPLPQIIVLTTFQRDGAVAHAVRAGASGFLLKSATPDFVLSAIRTVYEGQAVIAPTDVEEILRLHSQRPEERASTPNFAEDAISALSPREKEIYLLVAKGLTNGAIATTAFISETTVKTHVGNVLSKLKLTSRAQIIAHAYDNGLVR